jgi:hypothetical protein
MTTAYNNSSAAAMTGTAAALGEDFTLSTGSSRTFFTVPALGANEALTLQIRRVGSTDYIDVGDIVAGGDTTGVVTARGAGDSTFRVNKSSTGESVAVFFD